MEVLLDSPRARQAPARRGQPELTWPGKRRPGDAPAPRLRLLETVGGARIVPARWPAPDAVWRNQLVWGDNLAVMRALRAAYAGRIALVYIDPPFATGADYVQRVPVARTAGAVARAAFRDRWAAHRADYLQMLYERLVLVYELLADGGALYVHLDPTMSHYVKVILDEVFGPEGFQREIVWRIGWVSGYKSAVPNWVRNHDTILYYTKGRPAVFNKEYVPYAPGYRRRGGGRGRGYPIEDVWNANPCEQALRGAESLDSIQIKSFSREKTGFPTQKNESLLRRIVRASSCPGDLVADFFCGSGTTLVVAEQLGRRWLGVDVSAQAVAAARRRLLARPLQAPFVVLAGPGSGPWCEQAVAWPVRVAAVVERRAVIVRLVGPAGAFDALAYWAVDFAACEGSFHHDWHAARPRPGAALATESPPYRYAGPGTYRIAVRLGDVQGREWEQALTVRVC